MASTLVVKVKCGDTLRRFNTYIGENQKLVLNMEQLKEKIRSLFNLAVDNDFSLTYTDTDGDTVTLIEDCDLDEAVLQRLNPIRMVVNLKTVNKGGHSNVKASGNSTPMESPRVQQSIENIQAGVEEVVNTVPEPLRGVLLKLTRDLASTASAPVIADIIHSVSKIGESFACQGPQTFAQKEWNGQNKDSEGESSSGLSGSKSSRAAEVKEEKLTDKLRQVKDKAVDSGFSCVPDLNNAPPPPPRCASNITGKRESRCPMLANTGSSNLNVNPFEGCLFPGTQVDARFPPSYKGDRGSLFKRSPGHFDSVDSVFHTGVQCDVCGVNPITGPRFKSKVRYNYDLCSLCYEKSGNEADYVRIDSPLFYRHIMKALHRKHGRHGQPFEGHGPFKPVADPYLTSNVRPASLVNQIKLDSRFILDVNVMDGTVMAPSTRFTKIWRMRNTGNVVWPMGTRLLWTDGDKFSNFLSVDLEIPAFGTPIEGELDVAVDFVAPKLPGEYVSYWRMSSPSGQLFGQRVWVVILVHRHGRQPFEGHGPLKPVADPYLPSNVRPASLVNQIKLDSRFILDVNVMDGTVMAPSTRFTKIWRMRNTGNVVWPMGTRLLWTDGDKFSNFLSVDLEIPAFGTPIEGELDVAVDFVAPKLPGEYVSYWRMSSPSGQLFGQRVWVVILVQVDASPDPLSGSFGHLNLNLPPQGNELNEPAVIDINVEPSVNNLYYPSNSSAVVDPVESVAVSSKGVDEKSTTVTGPVIESAAEPLVGKPPVEDLERNLVSKGSVSEATDSARNEQDLNFPTNDTLLVGDVFYQATAPPFVPSVSYPIVDSSNIEVVALPLNASSNVASVAPSPQSEAFHEDEESLLMELSEMGFNQVDLNREILKMNNYDMEEALVDLCEISEWDPIFDELEEMGFSDRKKNAKLLVKNKGSIKRVVMDLVSSERSQ